ncbi:hypothetical protein FJT64_012413 [Amphibalanus amphitrite]|uniref:Uncharacterized protein n=1 Tax=Amphibalanus amphitrite TaxID=1232801 RepID=A0A6A4V885_AMPAM|nr:hypothetical protein FJT64_012413 [Amphibalanus amphitrite]
MADLVPANREAVMEWLKEGEDQLDWSPHLKYVAALEGGGVTPSQLADRVRHKGALGNSFYLVEEARFPSVSLTHSMISESLCSTGLSEEQWHQIPRQCPLDKMADHTGCFFVVARKKK